MDFFDTIGALGLGSRLKRLGDMFMAETRAIYLAAGVDFEPRWFPVFFLLQQRGELTVTETASDLAVPHPYVSQLVKEMRKAKLVRFKRHPKDGRSRLVVFTAQGAELVNVLQPLWEDIREAVNTIIQGTQSDVLGTLRSMERLLSDTPTSTLVQAKRDSRAGHSARAAETEQHQTNTIRVRLIEQRDDPTIAAIIRTVMTENGASGPGFSIHDAEVDHISDAYVEPHTQYFVVTHHGHVVGGGGIAPLAGGDTTVCELKKMYLLPEARGCGAGRLLLDHCLEAAQHLGYTRCYLETLNSMHAAHRLYERAGFTRIPGPLGNTGHFSCDMFYMKDL